MVTVAELKAQAKQQGLKRYSKLKKAELIKLLNNNTNTPVKKTKVKKTKVRKLKYNEDTLRDMYPKLIGAFLTEQNKKYTKDELTIAYGKVDKVIQSKVEARKWKEAFDEKYPNKEIKQQKINKIFSKPKKTLSKIDKIKKEEKKEKIIQKKKDDKELEKRENLSEQDYNIMFAYMTGASQNYYTEEELLSAYKYADQYLTGEKLSEWKRVYNDKRRVGKLGTIKEETETDLYKFTNSELKKILKKRGVKGYSTLKKSQLINLILSKKKSYNNEEKPAPKKEPVKKKKSKN